MQLFNDVKQKAAEFASENATTLLTAGGVVGTVATAVLAGRAGFKASQILNDARMAKWKDAGTSIDRLDDEEFDSTKKEQVILVGLQFAPPVLTGAATVTAIVMANRMSAQKAAALAAAYGLAERNLSDYKTKIQEKLTGPKATGIDDELAQEAVNGTPGHDRIVIVDGEILCFDKSGGRYFRSTVEEIKQAVNTANAEIINHGFVSATAFYSELGLPANAWSDEVGFDMSNLIELTYSTAMVGGNRTCFVFEFRNLPKTEYGPKYES